jgi:hypothetical protein
MVTRWSEVPIGELLQRLALGRQPGPDRGPWVVAVDGRSGSGKTTLAEQLGTCVPRSVLVHTDDVAWHHSFFGWAPLLIEGVLGPVSTGQPVSYRPQSWIARSRPGAIEVPAGLQLLIVEGVGAGRRELMPYLDALVWVQTDLAEAERRGILRDGGDRAAAEFWIEWDSRERPFLADQRPWERADAVVSGSSSSSADPVRDVAFGSIGDRFSRAGPPDRSVDPAPRTPGPTPPRPYPGR